MAAQRSLLLRLQLVNATLRSASGFAGIRALDGPWGQPVIPAGGRQFGANGGISLAVLRNDALQSLVNVASAVRCVISAAYDCLETPTHGYDKAPPGMREKIP